MSKSINKQIDRINYVAGYTINETPKYRPIMDDSSFDSIPEGWNLQEETPQASGNTAPAGSPTSDPAASMPEPALATPPAEPMAQDAPPAPAAAMPTPEPAPSIAPSVAPLNAPSGMEQAPAPALPSKDDLQKEILHFQLDAMKKMSQKIDQLEGVITSLNSQQAELHAEVDKVRDPSDMEKFSNRKQDSSPYYFNLNDMWNGNTFQARMDNFNSKGIIQTEDGYVADFDQLPKLSATQVKDSFDQI